MHLQEATWGASTASERHGPDPDEPTRRVASTTASTLWRALYRDLGRRGSLLEAPGGESFLLRAALDGGEAHLPHRLLGPLPDGDVLAHQADLALARADGAWCYVDVVLESDGLGSVKAHAFDALHTGQRAEGCHPVLLFVRQGGRIDRDEIEAIAYPYAFVFGMHRDEVEAPQAYAALVAHIRDWAVAG